MMPIYVIDEQPNYHFPQLSDQDFGLVITPEDLLTASTTPMMSRDYCRPWRQMSAAARDVGSTIKLDKNKFHVTLDVQHFAPDEISVKTVDGFVIIKGKHEEKKDMHGYVSRQFTRKYALPEGCFPETVECQLSSDGVLSVIAPKLTSVTRSERSVPIAQTGPVRKETKDETLQDEAASNAE